MCARGTHCDNLHVDLVAPYSFTSPAASTDRPPATISQAQAQGASLLEGRLSEQGDQVKEVTAVLSRVQDSAAQERGATQVMRLPDFPSS